MELHQLRYFVAVAEQGGFTRAAEKCGVAQPSLSQQILKLERELKQPLFERLGRTVRLTEAGRLLHALAVGIVDGVDAIPDRLLAAKTPGQGVIHVGAIPTVAPYLLPRAIREFAGRFPQATVVLHENLTELTVRGCLDGELDLGIVATAQDPELFEETAIFTEDLLFALPPQHPLATQHDIRFEDAAGEPFIVMNEIHCLGEQILGYCKQQDCTPFIRCRSVQIDTIQELVALGLGISLIPAMARELRTNPRCVYRPITDPKPTRTIRSIIRRGRVPSVLVQEFLSCLQELPTISGMSDARKPSD